MNFYIEYNLTAVLIFSVAPYSFSLFIFMSVEFGGRLTQHILTSFIDKVISQPSAVFVCARV